MHEPVVRRGKVGGTEGREAGARIWIGGRVGERERAYTQRFHARARRAPNLAAKLMSEQEGTGVEIDKKRIESPHEVTLS